MLFPSTLKKVDRYAFANSGLREIELPNEVERIEDFAFAWRQRLVVVEPAGAKDSEDVDSDIFLGCESLRTLYVSRRQAKVWKGRFDGDASLTRSGRGEGVLSGRGRGLGREGSVGRQRAAVVKFVS